jgi:hypothetical protein
MPWLNLLALMAHMFLSPRQAKAISKAIRGGLYIHAPDPHYDILNPALASWRYSSSSDYCATFQLRDLLLWLMATTTCGNLFDIC